MNHQGQIWGLLLLIGCGLASCTYDDDTAFYPETPATVLWAETMGQGGPVGSLVMVRASGEVIPDWSWAPGANPAAVSAMAGDGQHMWLGIAATEEILRIDLQREALEKSFSVAPLSPHYLVRGEAALLFIDTTLQGTLGLLDLKDDTWEVLTFEDSLSSSLRFGPGAYKSQKYYLRTNRTQVGILYREARTLAAIWDLAVPVDYLEAGNGTEIFIYSGPAPLRESRIDYHTDAPRGNTAGTSWRKIRHSPIRTPLYGKEYSGRIGLSQTDSTLQGMNLQGVSDFEVDFFESQVYFLQNDSLFRGDLQTKQSIFLTRFVGNLKGAAFYRDFAGK